MMLLDFFNLNTNYNNQKTLETSYIYQIFSLSNAQFLIPRISPQYMHLLIRRRGDEELQIPLSYGPLKTFQSWMSGPWLRASYVLAPNFQPKELKSLNAENSPFEINLMGSPDSEELYKWLLTNIGFKNRTSHWQSIFKD